MNSITQRGIYHSGELLNTLLVATPTLNYPHSRLQLIQQIVTQTTVYSIEFAYDLPVYLCCFPQFSGFTMSIYLIQ